MSRTDGLDQHPEDVAIRARLRESMEHLHADSDRLLDTAIRTGQHRLRRRRLHRAVAVGAILAVTGAGSYALVTGAGGPFDGRSVIAAPPPASPSRTPSPTTSASSSLPPNDAPEPAPSGTGAQVDEPRRLPARVAALHLRRLAPSGDFSDFQGQESTGELFASLMIDRGQGKVGLQVNVQGDFLNGAAADPTDPDNFYSCQHHRGPETTSCDAVVRSDGSTLLRTTERVGEATVATADFLALDGTRIVVRTGDTSDLKYGGRARPGLTLDQAAAIATDPVWSLYTAPSDRDVADARRLIAPWTAIPG